MNGGPVSNHKGVNVPGTDLSMDYLSEKDKADLIWGAENDVDFIAASFVREAADVIAIRESVKSTRRREDPESSQRSRTSGCS